MNRKKLIKFEKEIARLYEQAKIKAPVHLSAGNEKQLIKRFKNYRKGDWVFSTYRSHYHWLLSGGGPEKLRQMILKGRSMSIYGKKFFTSAIVGAACPIALGVALALKRKKSKRRVWCFIGDMAESTGLAQECFRYASGHNLPVKYIVEDNGLSITTPTQEVWGKGKARVRERYRYKGGYPHAGTGKYVLF